MKKARPQSPHDGLENVVKRKGSEMLVRGVNEIDGMARADRIDLWIYRWSVASHSVAFKSLGLESQPSRRRWWKVRS